MNQTDDQAQSKPLDAGPFYHGTKAELAVGALLEPGFRSNYGEQKRANHLYFTATMDAAVWGAELAVGSNPGRIYQVEPTGAFENDPNLTDQKFPGNPTRSYRTKHPLRVVGEVTGWEGHAPDVLQHMLDHLEKLKQLVSKRWTTDRTLVEAVCDPAEDENNNNNEEK